MLICYMHYFHITDQVVLIAGCRPAGILAELLTNPQPMGQPSTHTTAKSMGSRLLRPRRYFAIKTHVSIGTCSKSYGSPNKALVRVEVQDATPGGEARNWVIRTPKQGVHWNKDPADRGGEFKRSSACRLACPSMLPCTCTIQAAIAACHSIPMSQTLAMVTCDRLYVVTCTCGVADTGVTREEAETRGVSLEEFFRQLNLFLLDSCGTDELPLVVVWDGSDMLLLDKATQKEGPAAAAAAEQLARVPVVQLETWWAESKSSKHPSIGVSPRQLKPRGLGESASCRCHCHTCGLGCRSQTLMCWPVAVAVCLQTLRNEAVHACWQFNLQVTMCAMLLA